MSWSPDWAWLTWLATTDAASQRVRRAVCAPGPTPRATTPCCRATSPTSPSAATAALVFSRALRRPLPDLAADAARPPHRRRRRRSGPLLPRRRHLALRSSSTPRRTPSTPRTGSCCEHPFPDGTFGDGFVRPQGWLDDRLQLLLVQDVGRPGPPSSSSRHPRSTGPARGAARWAWSRPARPHAQPRGRPRPRPRRHVVAAADVRLPARRRERDISWIIGLGVAAAIAVLMGLRWLWRRFLP